MSGGFFLHGALGSYNERLVLETGGHRGAKGCGNQSWTIT